MSIGGSGAMLSGASGGPVALHAESHLPGGEDALPSGVPPGGVPGQMLVKSDAEDYATEWKPNVPDVLFDFSARPVTWGHITGSAPRTTGALFVNVELAGVVWLEAGERVAGLAMAVTTAVAGSTIEIGMREGPAITGVAKPGNLLFSAGTINGGSATTQSLTVSPLYTCPVSGYYYVTALTRGGAPTVRFYAPNPPLVRLTGQTVGQAVGSALPGGNLAAMSTAPPPGGLAATGEHFNSQTSVAPLIAVKAG